MKQRKKQKNNLQVLEKDVPLQKFSKTAYHAINI